MKEYQVFEMPIIKSGEDYNDAKERIKREEESPRLVILRGGLGVKNPKEFMDSVVSEYIKDLLHNQFIEYTLDNPFVRVLVFGINEIDYDLKEYKEY